MTRASLAVGGLFMVFAAVVIVSTPHPPMNDASSHVATATVLSGLAHGDPFFAQNYRFEARPVPYWTATLVMAGLQEVVSPSWSFRLLMLLYALGLPLSVFALYRREAPQNLILVPLAAFAAFNWAYYLGEAPFLIGQPLIFWGYLLFRRLTPDAPRRRLLALLVVIVLIGFCHLFALVGLVTVCGADALRRRLRLSASQWIAAGCAGLTLAGLAWMVLGAHGTDANHGTWVFSLALYRLAELLTLPFYSPSLALYRPALLLGAVVAIALVIPHLRAGLRGLWEARNPGLVWPALAALLLAYPGPAGVAEPMGFEDIGDRFTLLTLLLGLGAFRLSEAPWVRRLVLVSVAAFGLLYAVDMWRVHRAYQHRAERLDTLIAILPEQSRLLPLLDLPEPSRADLLFHRYANWAVCQRHAYSPHLFARTGQQPLRHRHRAEFRPVDDRDVTPEEWAFYDYVWVQTDRETPQIPGLASHARFVAARAGVRLYRIAHGSATD